VRSIKKRQARSFKPDEGKSSDLGRSQRSSRSYRTDAIRGNELGESHRKQQFLHMRCLSKKDTVDENSACRSGRRPSRREAIIPKLTNMLIKNPMISETNLTEPETAADPNNEVVAPMQLVLDKSSGTAQIVCERTKFPDRTASPLASSSRGDAVLAGYSSYSS